MNMQLKWAFLLAIAMVSAIGCDKPVESKKDEKKDAAAGKKEGKPEKEHSHGDEDVLVWQARDIEHERYVISLGHHGEHLFAAHKVEPAAMIIKDAKPVADAKVFVSLLDADAKSVLIDEKPMVFEATTEEEPAHYAQATINLPNTAGKLTFRFRVELPSGGEFSQDVTFETKKH